MFIFELYKRETSYRETKDNYTLSNKKINDPHMQREASKYDNPVPSREFILEFLASQNTSIGHLDLCEKFALTGEDEIEALRRRLIAMCRDNQLTSNRNDEYKPYLRNLSDSLQALEYSLLRSMQ